MFNSGKVSFLRFVSVTGFFVFLATGFFSIPVSAQCTPTFSQETFRKVYRSNRIFFEGLADINGDGKQDAYGYELQPDNSYRNIVYVLNNGTGGFGDPVVINTSFTISQDRGTYLDHTYNSVNAGNLNNDGKLDFVVRSAGPDSTFYTLLSGGGGYTQSAPGTMGVHRYVIDIADLNGDSVGDILINDIPSFDPFNSPGQTINGVYYRLGNGDGTFGGSNPALGGIRELVSPVVGDLNNDGKTDVAYSYWGALQGGPSAYHVKVLINNGNAVFTERPGVPHANVWLSGIADVNSDGRKDLTGGAVFLNDGKGNFTQTLLPSTPQPNFPTGFINNKGRSYVMDYNGDGNKDVIITVNGQQNAGALIKRYHDVYLNHGANNITKAIIERPFLGLPADMNGDVKDEEIIFVNSTTGSQLMSATNEAAIIVRENVCTAPPVRGQNSLIDFGGDGISDIVMWRPADGQWHYLSNLAENTFTWGRAAAGDIPIPGDYDGDSKTDAAVFREPTGDWWISPSSGGSFTVTHFGLAGDIPIPGDYDGDGKADIAVFRPSEGIWYISYSGSGEFRALKFGRGGDIPIPRDYDGDGKDNIAIFRPENGDWYYLTSNLENYVGVHWGRAGDIPIPGDYDMDGKADIAVYRPGAQDWYILRSFDGALSYVHFGSGTDVPMLVDSDGDGVLEISTFRPAASTGMWYASSQPLFGWGNYGENDEKPLRRLLPNN